MESTLPPAGDTCAQLRILTRAHLAASGVPGCPVPYIVCMTSTSGVEVGPVGCSNIVALRHLVDHVQPAAIVIICADDETDSEFEKMVVTKPADPRKLN